MNISEDMAATAIAEPSTQVERKPRIAINGLGRIGRTFLKRVDGRWLCLLTHLTPAHADG